MYVTQHGARARPAVAPRPLGIAHSVTGPGMWREVQRTLNKHRCPAPAPVASSPTAWFLISLNPWAGQYHVYDRYGGRVPSMVGVDGWEGRLRRGKNRARGAVCVKSGKSMEIGILDFNHRILGWAPLVVFTPQMNVVVPVSLLWYVEVPSHMLPKHSSGQVLRKFRPLYWFGQAAVQALSGSPQRLLIYMAAGVGKRPWWAI